MSQSPVGTLTSTTPSASQERPFISLSCRYCDRAAVRRLSKTKNNPGRAFYKCPQDDDTVCKRFFKWEDEISGPAFRPSDPTRSNTATPSNSQSSPARPPPPSSSVAPMSPGNSAAPKPIWTNQRVTESPVKRKRSEDSVGLHDNPYAASTSRVTAGSGNGSKGFTTAIPDYGDDRGSPAKRQRTDANLSGPDDFDDVYGAVDISGVDTWEEHNSPKKSSQKKATDEPEEMISSSFLAAFGGGVTNADLEADFQSQMGSVTKGKTPLSKSVSFTQEAAGTSSTHRMTHGEGLVNAVPMDDPGNPFNKTATPLRIPSFMNGSSAQNTPLSAGVESPGGVSLPDAIGLVESLESTLPHIKKALVKAENKTKSFKKSLDYRDVIVAKLRAELQEKDKQIAKLKEENLELHAYSLERRDD